MSRRALSNIGRGRDLAHWLYAVEQLPNPWDDVAMFGRVAPLQVELGCGKGLFLSAAAAGQPQHNFLGLEISFRYASVSASRLASCGLENGRIGHGDGLFVFRTLLRPGTIEAVHVYFPDPWWKARHKKRRVMNPAFVADVERVLRPGGALHFWTDVEEYFQVGVATVLEATRLQGPLPVAESAAEHDLDYRTHFERRTRLAGLPVYRAEFRKP